jgi:hypothetical protein
MTQDLPVTSQESAASLRRSRPQQPGLTRSLARVGARGRLDRELRAIAVDLLGPFASDELPATCSTWVRATVESAIGGVAEASLAALVETLDAALAAAPPAVARRLDEARVRHDAGFI